METKIEREGGSKLRERERGREGEREGVREGGMEGGREGGRQGQVMFCKRKRCRHMCNCNSKRAYCYFLQRHQVVSRDR